MTALRGLDDRCQLCGFYDDRPTLGPNELITELLDPIAVS